MIEIEFNHKIIAIDKAFISLQSLLEMNGYTDVKMAVSVNQIFIPKSLYAITSLHNKDIVEIIIPMQGG